MTRRLSELHINAVIDAINDGSIERVTIKPVKKPKGAYNITYKTASAEQTKLSNVRKVVSPVTGQLMAAMEEIKTVIAERRVHTLSLAYNKAGNELSYQLIQKQE